MLSNNNENKRKGTKNRYRRKDFKCNDRIECDTTAGVKECQTEERIFTS